MEFLGSLLVYAGFLLAAAGAASAIRPLKFLRIHKRKQGGLLLLAGMTIILCAMLLPATEERALDARTRLDQYAPVWQFREVHSIHIDAQPERVFRAVMDVTAGEILFFRALTTIRRFGRPGPESVLNAPERLPILEVAARTTFRMLARESNREVVVGTVVRAPRGWRPPADAGAAEFQAIRAPGFAVAVMNFLVEDLGVAGCRLSTETRVYATDPASRRWFAAYWRIIYPGSALIRRMWLRAIRARALAG